MWRSFFLAMGLATLLLGAEFLAINKATLKLPTDDTLQQSSFMTSVNETFRTREFVPPEWAPWTLLSVGAVIVLYSCTASRE